MTIFTHTNPRRPNILDDLVARFEDATNSRDTANATLNAARTRRSDLETTFKAKVKELSRLAQKRDRLEALANKISVFVTLFGDADPEALDPAKDLQEANRALRDKVGEWQKALTDKRGFDDLKPAVSIFRGVFGNANPTALNPLKELLEHNEKIRIEGEILSDQQPLVEALELFREANPSKLPNEWLEDADSERQALGTERHKNELRTGEIKRELEELESVAMADDRVYAEALAALEAGKIRFERLHALIGTEAGARQESLLTLFSSALSAPVAYSTPNWTPIPRESGQ